MSRRYDNGNDGVGIMFNMADAVNRMGRAMQQGQRIEADQMDLEDEKGTRAAYDHIARAVGQSGDISSIEGDPVLNSRQGVMAMGRYMADRANNAQSRLSMLQNMQKSDDLLYQNTFRPLAMAANEAYRKGDMASFGAIATELSAKSPFPYQYQMDGDGNFIESFRSSKDGGYVRTGQKLTPQQIMEVIDGIMAGEQKVLSGIDMRTRAVNPNYLAAAARYRMGTILSNAEAMEDPKQWIPLEKNGKVVYAIPQNRHDDYSVGPSYRILDDKGGKSYMAGSLQELLDQGYVRSDVAANARKLSQAGRPKAGGGVSANNQKLLVEAFTTKDEDGNNATDWESVDIVGKAAAQSGNVVSALADYERAIRAAVNEAARQGNKITRAEAMRAANDFFIKMLNGQQAAPPPGAGAGNTPPPGDNPGAKAGERTGNALAGGQNTPATKPESQPASARKHKGFWEEARGIAGLIPFNNPLAHPSFNSEYNPYAGNPEADLHNGRR